MLTLPYRKQKFSMKCQLRAGHRHILHVSNTGFLVMRLSLQYKKWNVIILGIISLNHLGGQFLSGLLSNRVGTAAVEQSAGKHLPQQISGTVCNTPGVGRRTCVLPENRHSAKAIIRTTSRSLGSLAFEQNGSCSHPYSQRLAPFTTTRWAMALKTTEPHTYVCIQSSFQETPLAHARIHLKSYRNN